MSMTLLLGAVFALQSAPQLEARPYSEPPRLSIESQAHLRCSAAFALVSFGQAAGSETALQWPAIDERGREFFVRAMARIMDETGIDRDAAAELAKAEAQRLLDAGEVDQVMPACLAILEASGL